MAQSPKISIIIPTFNWSAALKCSIESVLLQTFRDFELLVIGDGCTDDSAEVARSFADDRVVWTNLETNSGNQVIPNNHGISIARGEFIAYLGHDDIWYPTHLRSLLTALESRDADLAGGVAILYGPPHSGFRAVTGILEGNEFRSDDFLVPSSIMHRRSLIDRIGLWRNPSEIVLPPDCEFQKRAFDSGARIVTTDEVSVFKFNAAWRKRSYVLKTVDEQQAMLQKIHSGRNFRQAELIDVVRSFLEDRYIRVKSPVNVVANPGELVARNAQVKGVAGRETLPAIVLNGPLKLDLEEQAQVFDWYPMEEDRGVRFRWSGPSTSSTLQFPVRFENSVHLRIHVPFHLQQDLETGVKIFINDAPAAHTVEHQPGGGAILSTLATPPSDGELVVAFQVAKTVRPVDLGWSADRRWLGIAVSSIDVTLTEPRP